MPSENCSQMPLDIAVCGKVPEPAIPMPEQDRDDGSFLPLTALRYLRYVSKKMFKKMFRGDEITSDDIVEFSVAIMVANSVHELME